MTPAVRIAAPGKEDMEDLRDLNAAINRNANKPGTPWVRAKKELGLG